MRVRVGTSGYNYPEWKGTFYPADIKAARMLPYYAERFSTVEINATFYRMPTPATVEGWASAVPGDFTFVLKAPQRITHFARLANVDDAALNERDERVDERHHARPAAAFNRQRQLRELAFEQDLRDRGAVQQQFTRCNAPAAGLP